GVAAAGRRGLEFGMPNFRGSLRVAGACGAVALAAGLAACAPRAEAAPDPRPVVLATFTVLADIAGVVAGPDVRVESLTGVGTE
ncbi:hypothetical protein ACQUZK_10005, partial [Streptococcus pyogenes]|uniref:hypothetical protein n=1 Tax=Streptococcus pyogenes TaxID=1314 RepID=UPI003DA105A7